VAKDPDSGTRKADLQNVSGSTTFAGLHLAIGTSLVLETHSPVRKLGVRLLGFLEGRSLLVTAPLREGKEVYLEKGTSVVVRLLEGKQVCAFESHVLYRSIQPYSYYHLAYPDEIEVQQVRSSERVNTLINANIDSDFDIIDDWPKRARINNLSRTGARLIANESLGQFGHELLISFDIDVSGMHKTVSLAGIVRNIDRERDEQDNIHYVVGVQFLEMTDEARLSLANYIYEQDR